LQQVPLSTVSTLWLARTTDARTVSAFFFANKKGSLRLSALESSEAVRYPVLFLRYLASSAEFNGITDVRQNWPHHTRRACAGLQERREVRACLCGAHFFNTQENVITHKPKNQIKFVSINSSKQDLT
jgi:hypothetical protein